METEKDWQEEDLPTKRECRLVLVIGIILLALVTYYFK
jgi:hypothetical protein